MSIPPAEIRRALAHLRKADPVMKRLIATAGPFTLKLERNRYRMLVRSIVSQQLSAKAAKTIYARLQGLVLPQRMTAERLAQLSHRKLRSAGLSNQKASYIADLSQLVVSGELRLRRLGRMSDEEVIEELTQVRGIGRWTAQMLLIFSLGRLDVFPYDDLGVRTALRNLYGLDERPDKPDSEAIAQHWRPYSSVASWYCWRSLENGDTPG